MKIQNFFWDIFIIKENSDFYYRNWLNLKNVSENVFEKRFRKKHFRKKMFLKNFFSARVFPKNVLKNVSQKRFPKTRSQKRV